MSFLLWFFAAVAGWIRECVDIAELNKIKYPSANDSSFFIFPGFVNLMFRIPNEEIKQKHFQMENQHLYKKYEQKEEEEEEERRSTHHLGRTSSAHVAGRCYDYTTHTTL